MKIADLKPHPKNEEIYGYNEDISDLVEKIRRSNRVHTLVVNSDNYILAGHRRRRACMQLGIKEVNVEIRDFDSPEEEIEFIIDDNATREKTAEQKSREAKTLKEIEEPLALKRKSLLGATGGRGNKKDMPNSAYGLEQIEQGTSRDIVAKKVGLRSGHEVDRGIRTVDIIDDLIKSDREEDAELIRGVLNNGSISSAEELARNIDIVEIPSEAKELIKSGKKSPYSFIEKAKKKDIPQDETKVCSVCGNEFPIAEFYNGKNVCKNCCAEQNRERKSGIFKDSMGNLIEYDKSIVGSEAMMAAIADVKEGKNLEKGVNYEMEFQLFQMNMNDYFFANQKFLDGDIFKNMPFEIINMFNEEVERLSDFIQQLKTNLK